MIRSLLTIGFLVEKTTAVPDANSQENLIIRHFQVFSHMPPTAKIIHDRKVELIRGKDRELSIKLDSFRIHSIDQKLENFFKGVEGLYPIWDLTKPATY